MPRLTSVLGATVLGSCLTLACVISACFAREPPPVLLLVTVDTLRADRIGAYGSTLGLTPRLDGLAAHSIVFERAYAPTPLTVPSVSAILTGRYPEHNGIHSNESIVPEGIATLASALSERGYRTGAVVSSFVLRKATELDRGFDLYDNRFDSAEGVRRIPEGTAPFTTARASQMLDFLTAGGAEKLFLWVHYQDPHGPYTPPEAYRERYLEIERKRPDGRARLPLGDDHRGLGEVPDYQRIDDRDEVAFYRAGYHGEIRFADREIGRLFDELEQRSLLDQAVVVFVADHGEGLGEDDYWFAHGERLTDPLVRVPLLLRVPGLAPQRRDDLVSLVDVLPTLLALFDVPAPADLAGRDLLEAGAEDKESAAYLATLRGSSRPRFGLVSGRFKYVVTQDDGETSERLFRLGDETRNLAERETDVLERMRGELARVRERMRRLERERWQTLTDADRARLRALGYVPEAPTSRGEE